jgi:single-strand DNA-binding protein
MAQGDVQITVVGNLVADPELRFTQKGTPVASFRVATTSRVYKDGQWVNGDEVFLSCSLWREAAENMVESLSKGMRVIVTGRLKQRSWEKDGVKRTETYIEVDEVGPSLKFARAQVTKTGASKPKGEGWLSQQQNQAPASDPWNSAPQDGFPQNEQPPF